ncbi:MAG: hypothetical protein ACP5H9_02240 [Candidatus Woesearchaeota archaeon]
MPKEEEILSFLRTKGPILPSQLAEAFKTSILIASAILSELSSRGIVKISALKVGNSPLYYLPGQEPKLQDFISKLNEKDRQTVLILKEKRVLQDSLLDPLTRVSLRQIKDFAKPFFIKKGNDEILFWRWYLLDEESAKKTVQSQERKEEKLEVMETKQKEFSKTGISIMTGTEKEDQREKQAIEKTIEKQFEKQAEREKLVQKPIPIFEDKNIVLPKPKKQRAKAQEQREFLSQIMNFFAENNITIESQSIASKNREFDFIIKIKTPVGELNYFCKVLNKKSINEADLSKVFVQAQSKKIPAMLLVTGKLTKKAKEFFNREVSSLIIKEIKLK